jgi:hypothetical protein
MTSYDEQMAAYLAARVTYDKAREAYDAARFQRECELLDRIVDLTEERKRLRNAIDAHRQVSADWSDRRDGWEEATFAADYELWETLRDDAITGVQKIARAGRDNPDSVWLALADVRDAILDDLGEGHPLAEKHLVSVMGNPLSVPSLVADYVRNYADDGRRAQFEQLLSETRETHRETLDKLADT